MKAHRILLSISLIFCFSTLFSQSSTINRLVKRKPTVIKKYQVKNTDKENTAVLYTDFGSPIINNTAEAERIKDKIIYRITLIYTSFRVDEGFDQPKLNKERLSELKKIMPQAFTNSFVQWQFIAQSGAKNDAEAKTYFHGFVVEYINREVITTEEEIVKMDDILSSDSLGEVKRQVRQRKRYKRRREYTGKYFPRNKKKRKEGIVYNRKWFGRKRHYILHVDTIKRYDSITVYKPSPYVSTFVKRNLDSSIFTILDRNKQWKDMLVLCDVTGSMSPYSTQVLVWHKLNFNAKRTLGYTFFNDGDNKPDNKKVVGKIGGIYFADGDSLQPVENTARLAMRNGGGGDAPENNCEAILAGLKKYPKCKSVVMIADNWADLKDYKLISKINKPIHIILCGVHQGLINTQYMDLARRTKGSIHTLEEDITGLMKVNEGGKIGIAGKQYRVNRGKFVLIKAL